MIDKTDAKILTILQENARIPNTEISRQVGLAPSAIYERIRKLEQRGIITGYSANLDPRALGYDLLVYIFIHTSDGICDFSTAKRLAEIPEVQEVQCISGEDCYLVKLRTVNTAGLNQLLRKRLSPIDSIDSTRTIIVLETVKETCASPLSRITETPDEKQ